MLCPKCVLARKIGEAVLKMKTGDEIRLRLYSDGYQVTNMPNAGKPVSGHGDTALEALESAGLTKGEKA